MSLRVVSAALRLRATTRSVWVATLLLAPLALESQSPPVSPQANASRSGSAAGEMSAEEVFNRFARRILFLTCEESADESGLASGVLVSSDGLIATNAHVVEKCRSMTATYIDGAARRYYEPVLKYYDEQSDTAVLKIAGQGFEFFALPSRPARVGERVYAIGNPRGFEQSISEGIVSGNREEDGVTWIQHSAPISPGSSGGALIGSRGELLGINSRYRKESQNLNFAVPAATLAKALSSARGLTGFLDFPPNTELTGTYSGVVQNITAGLSADFTIFIGESKNGAIQGCMAVKPPLLGSGYLRGTVQGLQFSFDVVGYFVKISFTGERDARNLSGSYLVSFTNRGSAEKGTFVLHKASSEGPTDGFKVSDCATDINPTRVSAELGDAEAQTTLGAAYEMGQGVPKDYAQAATWYRKAADQGYARAQNFLGYLYEAGRGVPQDYAEAAMWYRKAADQGNPRSEYVLGGMYHNGQGVPQNYGEAATWYRKAAEQGFAPAEVTLGVAYATGEGVPQSYSESYFWLKVAEAGNPEVKPEDLVTLLERIAAHLTAVEVAHAQARVREWLTGRK